MMPVWSRRVNGGRVRTHGEAAGSHNCQQKLTSTKILDLIEYQNSHVTHMQCLFFIGHDLHPCIACFPVITLLILSTVCQQYLLGSLQVKAIYYRDDKNSHQEKKENIRHVTAKRLPFPLFLCSLLAAFKNRKR